MKRSALDAWLTITEGLEKVDRVSVGDLQLRKLNRQLGRLSDRQGFYRHLPGKIGSLAELSGLPFTTPEDIHESGNRMVLVSQQDIARVTSADTSGTSGFSKRLYYTEADRNRTVAFFTAGISQFAGDGDRVGIAMPFSGEGGLGELIAAAVRNLGATPVEIGIGKTYQEIFEILQQENPNGYIGMPVQLLSILRAAKHWDIQWDLRHSLLSADTVSPKMVAEIRKLFDGSLWTHYGSRECGLGGAVSCAAELGMHIRENDLLIEVIDENGVLLPHGEYGELVITTLQQQAMPLIRYRTGDYGRILSGKCECGSAVLRIDGVERKGGELVRELDDSLFALDGIVDTKYRIENGTICIEAYTNGNVNRDQVRHAIRTRFSVADGFRIELREIQPADRSLYIGKRRMEGETV